MRSKRRSRARASKRKSSIPQIVPLYQTLLNQEKPNAVETIFQMLDAVFQDEPSNIDKSILTLVLKICGVEGLDKMEWDKPIESLENMIQEFCKKQKPKYGQTFHIIDKSSSFHKEFIKRLKHFFQILISDEGSFIEDTDFMKKTYESLEMLSKCRVRQFREASIGLVKIIVVRLAEYHDEILQKRDREKAKHIQNLILDGYLRNIVKVRFRDISSKITEKSFEVMHELFKFNQQLYITEENLEELSKILQVPEMIDIQYCLKLLLSLLNLNDKRFETFDILRLFFQENLQKLEEIAVTPSKCGPLAMKVLFAIKKFDPEINSLKPKIVCKIFESYGLENNKEGIKLGVELFFRSLFSFNSPAELEDRKQVILIQLINLLEAIDNETLLVIIFQQFFRYHRQLFSFNEMLIILLSGYYHKEGQDIYLKTSEMKTLLNIILEFTKYVKIARGSDWRQQQKEAYNGHVMTNSRQIFLDHIPKHQSIAYLYIRLFTQLFKPIPESLEVNLNDIMSNTLKIAQRQECDEKTSQDEMLSINNLLQQCVELYSNEVPHYLSTLKQSFSVNELQTKNQYDINDILRMNALLRKCKIAQFIDEEIFAKLLDFYAINAEGHFQRLFLISLLEFYFQQTYLTLLKDPNGKLFRFYQTVRDELLRILFSILASVHQPGDLKLSSFGALSRTLSTSSSTKLEKFSKIFYFIQDKQIEILYEYIESTVSVDENILDFTKMVIDMGFSQRWVEKIFSFLFSLFENSIYFAKHPLSIDFLLKIVFNPFARQRNLLESINFLFHRLALQEADEQSRDKFIFWRVVEPLVEACALKEKDKVEDVIRHIVKSYFKAVSKQTKGILMEKYSLFLAESVENYLMKGHLENIGLIQLFFRFSIRKFDELKLNRLLAYFQQKFSTIDDSHWKKFINYLRINIKKKDRKTKNQQQSEGSRSSSSSSSSSKSSESEGQEENKRTKNRARKKKVGSR